MLKGIIQRGVEEYGSLTCEQLQNRRRAVFIANLNMPQSRLIGLLLTFPQEFKEFLEEYKIPSVKPVLVFSSGVQEKPSEPSSQTFLVHLRVVGS
jgi:hypothetical protein